MADENGDVKQASLEDSNMSNYGGKEMRDLRKSAAASDKSFVGAGTKVGLEVWRVENKRTKNDTPDFGVARWPKENYGSFYTGDSYLLLNTYPPPDPETGKPMGDKLAWDVHFWIGKESSQDEYGVAAYKAVELDDLLDDGPVQHREEQHHESALFQSYFPKGIMYMEGGIASGFRHVKPEEYKPRLFQVKRTKKTVRATEVPVSAKSMNKGDTFVLDAGTKVYVYVGESSNAFEKMKGGQLAHSLVAGRLGKSKLENLCDDNFWKVLGGTEADVQPALEDRMDDEGEKEIDATKIKLFRLSDASGKLTFKLEAEGKITAKQLDSNDVFIVDGNIEIFVWVGKGASPSEKSQCMKYAQDYLIAEKKPTTTPITRIKDGQVHHVFGGIVAPENVKLVTKKASPAGGSKAPGAAATPAKSAEPAFARMSLKTTGSDKTGNAPPVKASPPPAAASDEKKAAPYGGGLRSSGQKLW